MLQVVDTQNGPAVLVSGLALRLIALRQGCEKAAQGADAEFGAGTKESESATLLAIGADHVAVLLATELRAALVELMDGPRQSAPAEPKVGQYL